MQTPWFVHRVRTAASAANLRGSADGEGIRPGGWLPDQTHARELGLQAAHLVEGDGTGEHGSGAETTPGTSHRETASPAPGADQDAGEAQHAVPVHVLVQAGHGDDAAAQQRELGQDVAVPSRVPAHGLERTKS